MRTIPSQEATAGIHPSEARELGRAIKAAAFRSLMHHTTERTLCKDVDKLVSLVPPTVPSVDHQTERETLAIDNSRGEFEAFHAGRKNKGLQYRLALFDRRPDGTYAEESVQRHWWTWQNARATLACFAGGSPAKDVEAPAAINQGWMPIETAPKDGTEVLVWRNDSGPFIARYTSCDAFSTQTECDEMDEETLFQKDWFSSDFTRPGRLEYSEVPTLWMPLPAAPTGADT